MKKILKTLEIWLKNVIKKELIYKKIQLEDKLKTRLKLYKLIELSFVLIELLKLKRMKLMIFVEVKKNYMQLIDTNPMK